MIGEKLGSYLLLEQLGTGSMGTVYRAERPGADDPVVVKLVRSKILYDTGRRERFLQEILAASEVRHPALVPILEIGDDGDDFFIVTPFLDGRQLDLVMGGKPIHWPRALEIAAGVGEALSAAHDAGAVHRGLKPRNIWILSDGSIRVTDLCLARFTEFGHASPAGRGSITDDFGQTLIPLATLSYMSPEQVRGAELDHRTDIFSLGVVLYEMLTGRHPFSARNSLVRLTAIAEREPPSVTAVQPRLPGELDAVLRRALAKNPADRYASMQEMLTSMRRVSESIPSSRPGSAGTAPRACSALRRIVDRARSVLISGMPRRWAR